jgi:hypothetical protein
MVSLGMMTPYCQQTAVQSTQNFPERQEKPAMGNRFMICKYQPVRSLLLNGIIN